VETHHPKESGGLVMKRKLILHDLPPSEAEILFAKGFEDCTVFAAAPSVRPCVGCFGCWLKTPGKCVIKDRAADFPQLLAAHEEIVLVSAMTYGGLSPDVKAVLERGIGALLPFFRDLNGEMHHAQRYEGARRCAYVYYGGDITDNERETAERLAAANALNLNFEDCSVRYFRTAREGVEAIA
jgi:multimeric flavodoxin WrbA